MSIDSALAGAVVGLPQITVESADPQLANVEITGIQPATGGFTFNVRWPAFDSLDASTAQIAQVRVTFRVTFAIGCGSAPTDAGLDADAEGGADAGDTRRVTAVTYVEPCEGSGVFEWVSSGTTCSVCRIVAEMAPSPIVPDKDEDDLPLGRAVRLRVMAVARIGRTVVLLAENDGGSDLDYSWHPSAGAVERVAADVVVWTPPDGNDEPHAIQVAVQGAEAAAVATFLWEEAA